MRNEFNFCNISYNELIYRIDYTFMKIPKSTTECAFNIKTNDGVCSDASGIEVMKKLIQNLNPGEAPKNMSNKEVVEKTKKTLNCDEESCVVAHPEFEKIAGKKTADEIKKKRFKPDGPWNSKEWLNNFNIDQVLDQWKDIYPGFIHIPFQMRDFEQQNTELATINLADEYRNGMKSFGTVVNTDPSDKGGTHWFCIYGDFDSSLITLEYFNSSGELPLTEIHEWLHKSCNLLEKKMGKKVKIVIVSRNEIQKSDSECGLFSMFYIYSRLNDIPYQYFSKLGSVTDDDMYEFRKYLFRKYP